MRPKVLLLDEPLSALDKKLREQMQVELRHLQQAVGITFILVTHDQYEALAMSDRIAVMFDGKIAQVATPKEIYQHPINRQVADFLGGMNFVAAEIVDENAAYPDAGDARFRERSRRTSPKASSRTAAPRRWVSGRNGCACCGTTTPTTTKSPARVVDRHYFGEITHLIVEIPGLEQPLSVIETNDFGADDIPVGSPVRLAYDPEALVAMRD